MAANGRLLTVYHPEMPKHLPILLFMSRAVRHIGTTILTWLRFLLVCYVWLGILPWTVRWMWRFWFWLGDGGWAWWRKRPYHTAGIFVENTTLPDNTSMALSGNDTISLLGGALPQGELVPASSIFTNITRSSTLK